MDREAPIAMKRVPMFPAAIGWQAGPELTPADYDRVVHDWVVAGHGGRARRLGVRDGFCRMCAPGGDPERSFRKDAHVVPQALGNRVLLTLKECDACNEHVGSPLEGDLVALLGISRAVARPLVAGEVKVKTKRNDGYVHRVGADLVRVAPGVDSVRWTVNRDEKRIVLDAEVAPLRLMNVGRAVALASFRAAPRGILTHLAEIRAWIRRETLIPCALSVVQTGPTEDAHLSFAAYRRRSHLPLDWPPWVFTLGFSRAFLVCHLAPGLGLTAARFPMPPVDPRDDRYGQPPSCIRLLVDHEGVTRGLRNAMEITYQSTGASVRSDR